MQLAGSRRTACCKQGLPGRKLIVIGNGLPPEAFARAIRRLWSVAREVLRVGMSARLKHGYKNQGSFLRAAARLVARDSRGCGIPAGGDGPLRPEHWSGKQLDLGLEGRVRFMGDRRDISACLASMDVSVVPSATESLSNVIAGVDGGGSAGSLRPRKEVGGNIELGGDGRALLVAPNDEEDLAERPGTGFERRGTPANHVAPASCDNLLSENSVASRESARNIAGFILMCSPAAASAAARDAHET